MSRRGTLKRASAPIIIYLIGSSVVALIITCTCAYSPLHGLWTAQSLRLSVMFYYRSDALSDDSWRPWVPAWHRNSGPPRLWFVSCSEVLSCSASWFILSIFTPKTAFLQSWLIVLYLLKTTRVSLSDWVMFFSMCLQFFSINQSFVFANTS